jgi:phytoene/squalene synthetase
MFVLIPIAAGLEGDTESVREKYFEEVIGRMEERWETNLRDAIVYKRSYCVSDFKNDYHSFKGNAYGLANTLLQTANLKPSCKSKKLHNMYYTGQLTVPGPGVPPSLISGELVAKLVHKEHAASVVESLYDETTAYFSKKTTTAYSTSFSSAINLLQKKMRQPIYDIYAYVRFADEIVDTFHQYDKATLLAQFRKDTYTAFEQNISLNPILHRFQLTYKKYNIDPALLDAFLDSMEMDLVQKEHDEASYDKYIYGSAEVVGLMCLYIFCKGNVDQYHKLKDSARSLGAAFQKVNFLRDIKADYEGLKRVYFPNCDFANFTEFDKSQIEKDIQNDFDHAIAGIRKLPLECRFGVYVAYKYYYSLFNKIKSTHHREILNRRIRIPDYGKLLILAKAKLRVQFNLL